MQKRASESVINYIKNEINNKNLKAGSKLPSERDLSKKLRVSRASIREGLRELEQIGLTKTIKGRGSYIQNEDENNLMNKITQNLTKQEQDFIYDMLDYRRDIEVEAARLAAKRATTSHLLKMRNALELMSSHENHNSQGDKADLLFHTTMIEASQNKIFIELIDILSEYMRDTIKQTRKYRLVNKVASDQTLQEHKDIYLAIATGDSKLAADLVEQHIAQIKAEIIEFELTQIK